MKSNNLIAYAMDFASFLIQNTDDRFKINNIILFGSVARGDYNEKSDIDIFIDTKNKEIEKEIDKIVIKFHNSLIYTKYWNLLGISREISIKIGELEKWDLKESIISDGITLYGKYIPATQIKTKLYNVFELKIKGSRKNKIRIWRKLYGYTQKINKKIYECRGLIKEYGGKKIGKATFIIPIGYTAQMTKYLKQNKVLHYTYRIWSEDMYEK